MAAKPVPLSLAAVSLAFGLALPVQAQVVIDGSVQVNLQALDQLGGPRGNAGTAAGVPLLGSTGARGVAPTGRRPLIAAEPEGPKPLLGETKSAAPRARAAAATRQAPKTASKSAPAIAAAPPPVAGPAMPAPAAPPPPVVTAPPPVAAPPAMPAPAMPALAMPQVAPGSPTPVTPAPVTPAPEASAPAAPAPAPAPPPPVAPAPEAAAPAPSPAPAPAPAAPPQVAAAPAAPRPAPAPAVQSGMVTIPFTAGQGDLPAGGLAALDALAQQYMNGEDRLQIRAYAANSAGDGGSGARRLSLTRALAVRQYLIDRGIRSTRIDVRALGAPTEGAADRVEVSSVGR